MSPPRAARGSYAPSDDGSDLVKAVRSALQRGTLEGHTKMGNHLSQQSSYAPLNGRKDMRGLPSSPNSSCASVSDCSSVISDSIERKPKSVSPRPGRAVLYHTYSGNTVVIPPLNFRLLRK
eukprot:TRINITY_DN12340_c0_g1_i1.p2 TRINITY_DN12340_c0_g1~~TRINITY_DN12340_c0_g1_i1.p2  ORF type:complete len:121 (-),score=0.39 TRINITY_DN12340_c0_g1_i1:743-1105(-)